MMLQSLHKILLVLLFLLPVTCALAGGGWTHEKNKGYYSLSQWWMIASEHYTDEGLKDPNVTTGLFNTAIYAEFGFSNKFTGILYFPFFSRTYMNNRISRTTNELLTKGEALNSVGDLDIGIKYGILKKEKVALAASLILGIPTGNSSGGSQGNLQTGDGEFNQIIRFDLGVPFKIRKTPLYSNTHVLFNNRTNKFSEEFGYGLEVGVGLAKERLWLSGKVIGVVSFKNGQLASEAIDASFFANNAEYASYSLQAAGYLTRKLGVSFNFTSPFYGKIIFAAPAYSVSVFLDIK